MRFCRVLFLALLCACQGKMQTVEPPVVIIGAGVAGLTTAYHLQKQGILSHVIEAECAAGGRVATAIYGPGTTGEYGMQEMWDNNPLLDIARELNVALDAGESAFSSVVLNGHMEPFVGDTTDSYFTGLFDPNTRAALDAWRSHAAELSKRARTQGLGDGEIAHLQEISLADWLTESKLPPRAREWITNTVEVEMAAHSAEMSALSALLDMDMFFGVGMQAHHAHGGNSQLLKAIIHNLRGPITLGAPVTAVHKTAEGFEVRYNHDHVIHTVRAQRVVVTVPYTRLHQIYFDPPLPGDVWMGVNSLRLGQYTVVHFVMDTGARPLWTQNGVSPFPVLGGPELGAIYGALPQGATPQGDLFSVLLYGSAARIFHMAPRDGKITELKYKLDTLWPGFAKHVTDAAVYTYHPSALPVWPPGRSAIDATSLALRKSHGGVYLAGDYTRGAHATGAAQSGVDTARAIARDLLGTH